MTNTILTTSTMVVTYILGQIMSLGFLSFIINSLLLILIKKNIFGSNIKNLVLEISKKNAIILYIHYFVCVFSLIFIFKYNMSIIHLDEVTVDVVVNGVSANLSGEVLKVAKETLGYTAVFLGSARLTYLILAKNTGLNAFAKIGIIISSGGLGLTYYKIIDKTFNYMGVENNTVVLNGHLKVDRLSVATTGNYDIPEHPVLSLLFGMNGGINYNNVEQSYTINNTAGIFKIQSNNTSPVIEALNNSDNDWKLKFKNYYPSGNSNSPWSINSPNESESGIISFLIDILTDHSYLALISIYQLIMLF
jgi:hypothetical protein